jgi:hypothetical protein
MKKIEFDKKYSLDEALAEFVKFTGQTVYDFITKACKDGDKLEISKINNGKGTFIHNKTQGLMYIISFDEKEE